jgi:hypothetical protein
VFASRWLVMHLASGPDDTCNLFADFMQRTYADDGLDGLRRVEPLLIEAELLHAGLCLGLM